MRRKIIVRVPVRRLRRGRGVRRRGRGFLSGILNNFGI